MEKIVSSAAPEALGPYSQAIGCFDFIFVSGQLPLSNGKLITDPKEAIQAALMNVKHILNTAGSDLNKIVKITVFVTNLNDYFFINEGYASMLSEPYPARSLVEVKALPKGAILEIDCIAAK